IHSIPLGPAMRNLYYSIALGSIGKRAKLLYTLKVLDFDFITTSEDTKWPPRVDISSERSRNKGSFAS
ncbi:MAG: hypothetical protein COU10_02085, partial [Candidatus Harrisonbacteria bacterium CG10_big_fil_rev_8_21_14_0_10_45_28]